MVAEDDLAGRRRHVPADDEAFGAGRRLSGELPLQILDPVPPALDEIGAAGLAGTRDHLRVGQGVVRGGEHVEELAGDERDHLLMVRLHAWHLMRDVVPPLLVEQERLRHEAKGRPAPFRRREAAVAGQRRDAGIGLRLEKPRCDMSAQAGGLARRLGCEFELLAGRGCEMDSPVEIGQRKGHRRKPAGELRCHRFAHAIDC